MSPYPLSQGEDSVPSTTPESTYMDTFSPPTPLLETPSFENPPQTEYDYEDEHENIEEILEPSSPTSEVGIINENLSLTLSDVNKDPILSDLAHKQSFSTLTSEPRNLTGPTFKARPAPVTSDVVRPRMTKSSALRAGLNWDDIKPKSTVAEGEEVSNTPGYRRVGLGISIPSLASPSITPRPTRSSQLRSRVDAPASPSIKSPISQSTGPNLQRALSVPLISCLGSPAILPRQNRTSALRAAGEKGNAGYRDFEKLQQEKAAQKVKEAIAIDNKAKSRKEREERRKTIGAGLSCFEKPSMEVKQNKTSALRAAGEKGNAGYRNFERIQAEKEAQMLKAQSSLDNREKSKKEREERRKTLGLNVIALNEPEIPVKHNKASALRAAGEKGNNGYRNYEKLQAEKEAAKSMAEIAKENKERAKKEREERRKTFSITPGKPLITPRLNKTSLLRTNRSKSISSISSLKSPVSAHPRSRPSTSHTLIRTTSAFNVSSADDVSIDKKIQASVKSLGKPSITPRLNRTAILRTPKTLGGSNTDTRPLLPSPASATPVQRRINIPTFLRSVASSSSVTQLPMSPGQEPRPTKASLLRAELGNRAISGS
ncbi:uncharacterized protein I206_101972 [Kwoniella pini CBS 10737]|uniref:Uncharacterized protein n=1 Tax=Kwoniella pini CBS 10737 TaxID=1296096 RepID=A0A1B9HV68_9TREE|nr:uncharacterized protein I206_06937 [Kwoniella pini CBS 10737]OCF47159.1 hypothetical protein I206_06937 [Kwoniella pini CBS 10737]